MFRGTGRVRGRQTIVDKSNSGLEFLRYGRVVLEGGELGVATGEEDVAFLCLNGRGEIRTGGRSYELGKYDLDIGLSGCSNRIWFVYVVPGAGYTLWPYDGRERQKGSARCHV